MLYGSIVILYYNILHSSINILTSLFAIYHVGLDVLGSGKKDVWNTWEILFGIQDAGSGKKDA